MAAAQQWTTAAAAGAVVRAILSEVSFLLSPLIERGFRPGPAASKMAEIRTHTHVVVGPDPPLPLRSHSDSSHLRGIRKNIKKPRRPTLLFYMRACAFLFSSRLSRELSQVHSFSRQELHLFWASFYPTFFYTSLYSLVENYIEKRIPSAHDLPPLEAYSVVIKTRKPRVTQ